ncbi:MAG TPA: hypothetical protein VH934_21210 [Xanthobacteraceae bacterium]
MRHLRSWLGSAVSSLVSIAAALLVAASSTPANAQQLATRFQYSAKALCTLGGDIGFGDAFAPGRYRTVVNIHNPTDRKIEIARKFALSIQPGEAPGSFSVTPYKSLTLEADQAVAFNCFDLSNFYCPIDSVCVDFTALDGFLVVNSPVELDVVAVYTAHPKAGEVSTLNAQTIAARRMSKIIAIKPEERRAQPERKIQIEPFKPVKP